MKNLWTLFGLYGLLSILSAVIVNCQVEYEYEQDLNNPNQNLSPLDLNYQDMGNLDNVIPPDFNSDPFPDPNMDPFSRRTQVCYLILLICKKSLIKTKFVFYSRIWCILASNPHNIKN